MTDNDKDQAIQNLASSKDPRTKSYWDLGQLTNTNWLARWFLYNQFRGRGGLEKKSQQEEVEQLCLEGEARLIKVAGPDLQQHGSDGGQQDSIPQRVSDNSQQPKRRLFYDPVRD